MCVSPEEGDSPGGRPAGPFQYQALSTGNGNLLISGSKKSRGKNISIHLNPLQLLLSSRDSNLQMPPNRELGRLISSWVGQRFPGRWKVPSLPSSFQCSKALFEAPGIAAVAAAAVERQFLIVHGEMFG